MLHPTSSLKGFHLVASDAQSTGHLTPYWGMTPRFGISSVAGAMSPVDSAMHATPAPIERGRRTEAERGDVHLRSAHDVTGHTIHASDDEIGLRHE